jgi:hypothetical protein
MSRVLLTFLAAPLIACGLPQSLHLEDDVGIDSEDTMHSPYVRGSVVTIRPDGWGAGKVDEDWSLVADNDDIMVRFLAEEGDSDSDSDEEVDEGLSYEFRAAAEGSTTISLLNPDGEIKAQATIEVVMPDTVTLHLATAERTGPPELNQEDCDIIIVEGGIGGLVAEYWLDGAEVFGNGVLALVSEDEVLLDVDYSYSDKNLDWLQLTPEATGTQSVDLLVDGELLDTLTYEAVSYDAIATTALLGADETDARDGDWLELLVQAFDDQDCPVLGAQWTWHVDGELQEVQGDLYRYEFDESINTTLEASFGDHERSTSIHGVGSVQNSNAASCSAVGGAAMLVPALFGLLALTRRRED